MSLIYKMNRKAYKGWNYRDYMVSKQGKPQSKRKEEEEETLVRERARERAQHGVQRGWAFSEIHTCCPALSASPRAHECVRVSRCVVTDVVPRCFPAEDGLKVH